MFYLLKDADLGFSRIIYLSESKWQRNAPFWWLVLIINARKDITINCTYDAL